jgi:hypothetical protein
MESMLKSNDVKRFKIIHSLDELDEYSEDDEMNDGGTVENSKCLGN